MAWKKSRVFNTGRLDTQSSLMKMTSANRAFSWHNKEPASSNERDSITAYALLEQINVTRDKCLSTDYNVKLRVGNNKISLLGITVGLPNVGVHIETWNAGALGLVTLKGLNEDLLGDEVNSKSDKDDAEARSSVTHLIAKHGMRPPLVPPPEELFRMLFCPHFFRSIDRHTDTEPSLLLFLYTFLSLT
ncbi:beta-galactosidase [Trifolium repens]|nr:beta-galactosidase [Trifolium repens]